MKDGLMLRDITGLLNDKNDTLCSACQGDFMQRQ